MARTKSEAFSKLESQYGQPTFGGHDSKLAPITDRALPDSLIGQLKHLPSSPGTAFASPGESCEQPTPEEMAQATGVTLPHQPWHVANIWWDFQNPIFCAR